MKGYYVFVKFNITLYDDGTTVENKGKLITWYVIYDINSV